MFNIPELELSINAKCNLRCKECGFFTPNQLKPTLSDDVIYEHTQALKILQKCNIQIGSLAILGGEPTITPVLLEKSLISFSKIDSIHNIEVVSNGLYPKGLTQKGLSLINKLSISVYDNNKKFISAWKKFINRNAPHINLEFRVQKPWDITTGDYCVSKEEAMSFFKNCWYKKHCPTIERSRLFICSRSAKKGCDYDGLLLDKKIKTDDIIAYMQCNEMLISCKTCVPSMQLGKVKAGVQPNNVSLSAMMENAIRYLTVD